LYQRLVDQGVVRAEHGRILGLFPARKWPAQNASHEPAVRRLMAQALTQQAVPDIRTAALIALVHALGCDSKIVVPRQYGLSKRELRARAAEIAEGNWACEAVGTAIQEMVAAVVATTTAATIAATSGSGG
jgi:Golgi phosphoprotein 3 (GPP34)